MTLKRSIVALLLAGCGTAPLGGDAPDMAAPPDLAPAPSPDLAMGPPPTPAPRPPST
jgi:hypothetical protein